MEGGQILEQTSEIEGNDNNSAAPEMISSHLASNNEGDDNNSTASELDISRWIDPQLSFGHNFHNIEPSLYQYSFQETMSWSPVILKDLALWDDQQSSSAKVKRLASAAAMANARTDCFELAQFMIKRNSSDVADSLLSYNNAKDNTKFQIAAAKRQLNIEKYLLSEPERDYVTKSRASSKRGIHDNKPSFKNKSISFDKKQLNYKRRL